MTASARPHQSNPSSPLDLSVVIPLYDEEKSLGALHDELTSALSDLDSSYEIVYVNDGSGDGSGDILERLAEKDTAVGVVHFRRNFGKAAALDAGFKRARGDVVVTLDADLQDDPSAIGAMVRLLDGDCEVVSGWKRSRRDPLSRVVSSRIFNVVVSLVSGISLHDFNCGFKAYRREALEQLELYGELHRFVPVLLHWQGFRVEELEVPHRARRYGTSRYGMGRVFKGLFDLLTTFFITRYRARPLHFFGILGGGMGLLGFGILSYLTVLWFMDLGPIGSRPLLFLGMLLVMVGVQLTSTGLLAELMTHTRHGRPSDYVVRAERSPRVAQESTAEVANQAEDPLSTGLSEGKGPEESEDAAS